MSTPTEELRDLDAKLAERLDWELQSYDTGSWWFRGLDKPTILDEDWKPSSTWEGAGLVVEAMRERGYCIELHDNVISFEAVFLPHASRTDLAMAEGHADTAPLAIARAALEALEAEARVRELEGRP